MRVKIKPLILIPIDILIVLVCYFIGSATISNGDVLKIIRSSLDYIPLLVIIVVYLLFFALFDMYFTNLEHISFNDLFKCGVANVCATTLSFLINSVVFRYMFDSAYLFSNTTVVFAGLLILCISISIRVIPRASEMYMRMMRNKPDKNSATNVMIYGAGNAGLSLLKDLENNPQKNYIVKCFYDDDTSKTGSKMNGKRIYGPKTDIMRLVEEMQISTIIIAVPSASTDVLKNMIEKCKPTNCKLKILPKLYDLVVEENVSFDSVRDVDINDLLRRDESVIDTNKISGYITNERVLITGAGGSIGSELCRQILKFNPKKLVLFDIYENNVYDLVNELTHTYGSNIPLETYIGSVRDYERLRILFEKERPGVVFHAAAHKHVPLMEVSPGEAIKNNVFGTYNVMRACGEFNAKTFVLISTDKAVNPTNVMGTTKHLAEMVLQAYGSSIKTRCVAVRFGNVLGSNGSVIPLFKQQIKDGGPVKVTHKDITRFFMTIPEASRLVIQAGAMAKGGEIFILDMGEPVKIMDLARDMIRLSGLVPDVDIKIEVIGLRPGEKLYEELLREEEGTTKSSHDGIFIAKPLNIELNELNSILSELKQAIATENDDTIIECLKKNVSTYHPERSMMKKAYVTDTEDTNSKRGK